MHILIAIAGILVAISVWIWRTRNAANAATDLLDVANDVRLAARRFGFQRQQDVHPVDATGDRKVLGAGIALASLSLDGAPTQDQRDAVLRGLQSRLDLNLDEARDMIVLGDWLIGQCGGPTPAAARMLKRLSKLSDKAVVPDLKALIEAGGRGADGTLSAEQTALIADIDRVFR